MSRIWNTTGIYKAQKDRQPAKRSRRLRSTPPAYKLVMSSGEPGPMCNQCGHGQWTTAHTIICLG